MIFPFKTTARSFLGIDIGSSSIKVVELSRTGKTIKLENYAEAAASIPLLSSQETAQNLRFILEQAKIKTKKAVFTLPDFSSFFTWFDLPPMSEAEIPEAVRYEAKQHIPTPLSGVTLDWQIIEGGGKGKKIKILLVVVPNEFVVQYSTIAKLSQIEPQVLEAEVFALSRSSLVNENKITALVDIGARSTTCSIIDNGVLKRSYSFDLSGNELTQIISQSLNIDELKAEELKKKYGLLTNRVKEKNLREILLPLINLILNEIKKVLENFYQSETKTVQKVILAGGTALLPGLREYFESDLKKEVKITEPFFGISHPQTLEKTLKEIGPSYAIAVGAALRGLE
ncbi:type IV pilus assembly protein PilM [Patescibacteria group bacterium]|nr:type IV pilus assembly protein PilM [Patescibacteria group bacterium]